MRSLHLNVDTKLFSQFSGDAAYGCATINKIGTLDYCLLARSLTCNRGQCKLVPHPVVAACISRNPLLVNGSPISSDVTRCNDCDRGSFQPCVYGARTLLYLVSQPFGNATETPQPSSSWRHPQPSYHQLRHRFYKQRSISMRCQNTNFCQDVQSKRCLRLSG